MGGGDLRGCAAALFDRVASACGSTAGSTSGTPGRSLPPGPAPISACVNMSLVEEGVSLARTKYGPIELLLSQLNVSVATPHLVLALVLSF